MSKREGKQIEKKEVKNQIILNFFLRPEDNLNSKIKNIEQDKDLEQKDDPQSFAEQEKVGSDLSFKEILKQINDPEKQNQIFLEDQYDAEWGGNRSFEQLNIEQFQKILSKESSPSVSIQSQKAFEQQIQENDINDELLRPVDDELQQNLILDQQIEIQRYKQLQKLKQKDEKIAGYYQEYEQNENSSQESEDFVEKRKRQFFEIDFLDIRHKLHIDGSENKGFVNQKIFLKSILKVINNETKRQYDIDKLSNKLFVIDKDNKLIRIGWKVNGEPENITRDLKILEQSFITENREKGHVISTEGSPFKLYLADAMNQNDYKQLFENAQNFKNEKKYSRKNNSLDVIIPEFEEYFNDQIQSEKVIQKQDISILKQKFQEVIESRGGKQDIEQVFSVEDQVADFIKIIITHCVQNSEDQLQIRQQFTRQIFNDCQKKGDHHKKGKTFQLKQQSKNMKRCCRSDIELVHTKLKEAYLVIEVKKLIVNKKAITIEDHLPQQIEQLRSICITDKKIQMVGLLTNFKDWIFTRYDMMEEIKSGKKCFEYSKTFEILTIEQGEIIWDEEQLGFVLYCLQNLHNIVIGQ